MNRIWIKSSQACLAMFFAVVSPLHAEEIPVRECPDLSGSYRFDGLDNKACTTDSPNKAFAYPIPLAVHSAWHIQPGKTFRIEQEGCDKIIVRYSVENSTPSEHKEEISIKKVQPNPKDSVTYTNDSISYRQGNQSGCMSANNVPGTICNLIHTASFTLKILPNKNLQITSQKKDIGFTIPPSGHWDNTRFHCELGRTSSQADENDPLVQQGLRDHTLSPNETIQNNMRQPSAHDPKTTKNDEKRGFWSKASDGARKAADDATGGSVSPK